MRLTGWLIMAACVAGAPVTAAAQDAQIQTTTTLTEPTDSHWIASGFAGTNFGSDAQEASFDFGGSVGYLWNGAAGVELLANFSPEFELEGGRSALLLGDQPWINSYMFNAIGAVPVGEDARFQPYVSGGLGALTLRSDVLITDDGFSNLEPDNTQLGGNLGFGVMGFADNNVGFRGDVRYFRGFEDDGVDLGGPIVGSMILSDLSFWRATAGLAFKF